MSLPPLASPPAAAAAALRLQPRKPRQAAPPTPALRKGATPATAPLAPAKPPRRGGGAPAERPGPFASSWPSSTLPPRKEPRGRVPRESARDAPPPHAARGATTAAHALALARGRSLVVAPLGSGARSCESLSAAAPGGRGEAALRFSLSLPPEAIRVLQRRSLEKHQQQQQQQRGRGLAPRSAASPDAAKRPLAGSPAAGGDLRALLQVSLLNERHRYDDVEYEEEEDEEAAGGEPGASTAREGLVRKCTEWLRGVERAAARDRADKLDTLPHLSTL
uniref:Proline-rich protein 18 n=1 Tax=Pogona vitticeps TaxID=103695 RepID=A0ABM5FY88_9SAUR